MNADADTIKEIVALTRAGLVDFDAAIDTIDNTVCERYTDLADLYNTYIATVGDYYTRSYRGDDERDSSRAAWYTGKASWLGRILGKSEGDFQADIDNAIDNALDADYLSDGTNCYDDDEWAGVDDYCCEGE